MRPVLFVNAVQMREMLGKMNRGLAEGAFQQLELKLSHVDTTQSFMLETLPAMFAVKGGILHVGIPKVKMALEDAKEALVPDELLARFEEKLREAEEAQALLKTRDQLEADLKQAKEDGGSEDDLAALKAKLDQTLLAITALEE